MRSRLAALPPEQFTGEGAGALSHLDILPEWSRYRTVLLFLSAPREINTGPLLALSLSRGKKTFAPAVEGTEIRFFRVSSAAGPWRAGAFGLREPASRRPEDQLGREDFPAFIVVPGLAFDRRGNRLGKGGGYYDRFFAFLDAPENAARIKPSGGRAYFALGYCLETQIVPRLPAEAQDKTMDAVCTGGGIFSIVSLSQNELTSLNWRLQWHG
jgi:5-formyltetrahydrofolate cyclo-ligase